MLILCDLFCAVKIKDLQYLLFGKTVISTEINKTLNKTKKYDKYENQQKIEKLGAYPDKK